MTTTNKCSAIVSPKAPHPRMTLSYAVLKAAHNKVLYLAGEAKSAVMSKVLDEPGDINDMPVRGFLDDNLTVYWSA